jgi:hypothetical protein
MLIQPFVELKALASNAGMGRSGCLRLSIYVKNLFPITGFDRRDTFRHLPFVRKYNREMSAQFFDGCKFWRRRVSKSVLDHEMEGKSARYESCGLCR